MTNRAASSGDLAPARIHDLRRAANVNLGADYHFWAETPSTNDRAAELTRAGAPEGTLVVADTQSGGRGRMGRTWFSPGGQNLYLSLVLRPPLPAADLPPLTLLCGAALARALRTCGGAPVLKWPNDVLLPAGGTHRKTAGILTEMATEGDRVRHVIVGIGVNVNCVDFPDDLALRATSLRASTGTVVDRGILLVGLLGSLETAYGEFLRRGPGFAIASWRGEANNRGQRYRVTQAGDAGAFLEGTVDDIDETGALLLRTDDGHVHKITAGDTEIAG